jgi:hypothetical protein
VRGRLIVVFVALLGVLPAPPARAAAVTVVTIEGRGWGHGVGMSQYGARWMAEEGATPAQILQHFYPGTSLGTGRGPVRVVVHSVPSATVLAFPNGGEVRGNGQGFPVGVGPGGQVRVAFENGGYQVDRLMTAQSVHESSATPWGQVPTIPPLGSTTTTTRPRETTTTAGLLPVAPPSSSATTATTRPAPSTTTTTTAPTPAPPGAPPPTAVAPGGGAR